MSQRLVVAGIAPIQAAAHRMHNEWLAIQELAGTEIALEILALMKPLPPPSPEFVAMMNKWAAKMLLDPAGDAERDFLVAARAYCEVWFRHNRADARTRQSLSDAYRNLVKIERG